VTVTREVSWAGRGLLRIRQRLRVQGREAGTDATGPYWVFGVVRLHGGRLHYLHGRHQVRAPGPRFAVFMPPWSIVRAARGSLTVSTDAIATDAPLFPGAPARAVALAWPGGEPPSTVPAIERALKASAPLLDISREVAPSAAALRAKAAIDDAYARPVTLARLASGAGQSPSALSRAFRRAYGMPPVEYRHRLRIMDAMFRVAAGAEILAVLHEVGFGDASRLYRHFQGLLCAPPGSYSPRRSRNAKK
jgi:AraC-like DNA-binding protein